MKIQRIVVAALFAWGLSGLLYLGFTFGVEEPAGLAPTATQEDWHTDQEDPPPGDWGVEFIWEAAAGGSVSRVATPQADSYSYAYYSDAASGTCWAMDALSCTVPVELGHLDAYMMFPTKAEPEAFPGEMDDYWHPFMSVFEFTGYSIVWPAHPTTNDYFDLYFNYPEKRAWFNCHVCAPDEEWALGTMAQNRWYHFEIDWNLPEGAVGTGTLTVTQDDTVWVNETTLSTDSGGAWHDPHMVGVGVKDWHYTFADGYTILGDEATIYGCDEPWPTATPTPAPGVDDCNQYGHSSVLNVDSDCSAVLRLDYLLNTLPVGATISRATLHLYGTALEPGVTTIDVAPLNVVWGEMTTDWCRRTSQVAWALPGATAVPLDRNPGKIAEFTAAIGWVEVDLPPYVVEEWLLSNAANPGIVLSNPSLVGKYSIASREWYTEDYRPYLSVWYTD